MSDIIDINVGETIEEVTINVVDNLITVNINKVTGGGGSQTLAETLALGNVTGGENISISNGDAIVLDNSSKLKKGTTDAGNGGNKGIALKCSLDYELKWEAGRKYIMEQDGITIREVSHNFTNIPTATDDYTKGFVSNSRWILDNGDVYLCTDPTEGAAIWELVNTGTTPTLQQVTDVGNVSSNDIQVTTGSSSSFLRSDSLKVDDGTPNNIVVTGNKIVFTKNQQLDLTTPTFTSPRTQTFQNASGTLALTSDIPNTSTLVPYNGATTDVDLGEFELKAGQVEFDQTPTGTAGVGVMRWNDTDGTLDLGLKGGNVTLQIGQEEVVRVVNKTATNINLLQANYQAVRVTGAQGQRLKVDLAQATNDNLSAETIGLVTETINNNQEGFITTNGLVRGINTTGSLQGETWADGDIVYLSATTAGNITNVKPLAPNHLVIIGYVVSAHITQGTIFVKVDVGYELDELHNVSISTPLNNQALTYETSTQLWKNKTIDKTFVGLGNVDNTSDANKPVSTAQQTAIDAKVADSISDGVTTIAPSQNAVFDALALKQNILAYTPYRFVQTSQTAHTGTTAETIIATATIAGGTFNSSDVMKVIWQLTRPSGGVSNVTFRLKINTSNTLTGATLIGTTTTTTALFSGTGTRTFTLQGGNLIGFPTQNALTDFGSNAFTPVNTAYNTANVLYVFFTLQLANSADSTTLTIANITN